MACGFPTPDFHGNKGFGCAMSTRTAKIRIISGSGFHPWDFSRRGFKLLIWKGHTPDAMQEVVFGDVHWSYCCGRWQTFSRCQIPNLSNPEEGRASPRHEHRSG